MLWPLTESAERGAIPCRMVRARMLAATVMTVLPFVSGMGMDDSGHDHGHEMASGEDAADYLSSLPDVGGGLGW